MLETVTFTFATTREGLRLRQPAARRRRGAQGDLALRADAAASRESMFVFERVALPLVSRGTKERKSMESKRRKVVFAGSAPLSRKPSFGTKRSINEGLISKTKASGLLLGNDSD